MKETYLGDGCYASFDGYQIWLRAPRASGEHVIALDPKVYEALIKFVKRLREPVDEIDYSTEPQSRRP